MVHLNALLNSIILACKRFGLRYGTHVTRFRCFGVGVISLVLFFLAFVSLSPSYVPIRSTAKPVTRQHKLVHKVQHKHKHRVVKKQELIYDEEWVINWKIFEDYLIFDEYYMIKREQIKLAKLLEKRMNDSMNNCTDCTYQLSTQTQNAINDVTGNGHEIFKLSTIQKFEGFKNLNDNDNDNNNDTITHNNTNSNYNKYNNNDKQDSNNENNNENKDNNYNYKYNYNYNAKDDSNPADDAQSGELESGQEDTYSDISSNTNDNSDSNSNSNSNINSNNDETSSGNDGGSDDGSDDAGGTSDSDFISDKNTQVSMYGAGGMGMAAQQEAQQLAEDGVNVIKAISDSSESEENSLLDGIHFRWEIMRSQRNGIDQNLHKFRGGVRWYNHNYIGYCRHYLYPYVAFPNHNIFDKKLLYNTSMDMYNTTYLWPNMSRVEYFESIESFYRFSSAVVVHWADTDLERTIVEVVLVQNKANITGTENKVGELHNTRVLCVFNDGTTILSRNIVRWFSKAPVVIQCDITYHKKLKRQVMIQNTKNRNYTRIGLALFSLKIKPDNDTLHKQFEISKRVVLPVCTQLLVNHKSSIYKSEIEYYNPPKQKTSKLISSVVQKYRGYPKYFLTLATGLFTCLLAYLFTRLA